MNQPVVSDEVAPPPVYAGSYEITPAGVRVPLDHHAYDPCRGSDPIRTTIPVVARLRR
jgi:hypothetical protein